MNYLIVAILVMLLIYNKIIASSSPWPCESSKPLCCSRLLWKVCRSSQKLWFLSIFNWAGNLHYWCTLWVCFWLIGTELQLIVIYFHQYFCLSKAGLIRNLEPRTLSLHRTLFRTLSQGSLRRCGQTQLPSIFGLFWIWRARVINQNIPFSGVASRVAW